MGATSETITTLGRLMRNCRCAWFHGGGRIDRDELGRINWRCNCGRWSDHPTPLEEEARIIDRDFVATQVIRQRRMDKMIAEAFPLSMNMPEYVCSKLVHAFKLKVVEIREDCGVLTPENPIIFPFEVSLEYMRKHTPRPGGYFVVYGDSHMSFSPAEEFEERYTLVSAPEPPKPKQLNLELVPRPMGYNVPDGLQGAIEPLRGK